MSSQLSSGASVEALVRTAKGGNSHAVEALIAGDGPLRRMIQAIKRDADPQRIARRWEPVPEKGKPNEAEAAARVGVLEALDRFDTTREIAFTTFAYPFIKGAVLKALYPKVRRSGDERPAPRLVDLDVGVASDEPSTSPGFEALILKNDPGYGQEPGYLRLIASEGRAAVRRFVEELPERQRVVVRGIYFEGRSQQDLADAHGVTPQAISKLHNKALARGRDFLDPIGVAA